MVGKRARRSTAGRGRSCFDPVPLGAQRPPAESHYDEADESEELVEDCGPRFFLAVLGKLFADVLKPDVPFDSQGT